MPERARGVVLDAAGAMLEAVASGAAAMDHAVLWSRTQWWGRWLP